MLKAFQAARKAEIACALAKADTMKMAKLALEIVYPSQGHIGSP